MSTPSSDLKNYPVLSKNTFTDYKEKIANGEKICDYVFTMGSRTNTICGLKCKDGNLCRQHAFHLGTDYMNAAKLEEQNSQPRYIPQSEWDEKNKVSKLCDHKEGDLICTSKVAPGYKKGESLRTGPVMSLQQFTKCGLHFEYETE